MWKRRSNALWLAFVVFWPAGVAVAQDVPGIEICTVEKTMERRTSCLQSNVVFLRNTMTKDALDQQNKRDAAARELNVLKGQIEALKATVVALQANVAQLQARGSVEPKPKDLAK